MSHRRTFLELLPPVGSMDRRNAPVALWRGLLAAVASTGLALNLSSSMAGAEGIRRMDYSAIAVPPGLYYDFDELYPAPEMRVDWPIELQGVAIGKNFKGQRVSRRIVENEIFDGIFGLPSDPLTLQIGPPGHNLFWAFEPPFNSLTVLGVGPNGAAVKNGIGEGSMAFLFADAVCQIGFQTFEEGTAGSQMIFSHPGSISIDFFRDDGTRIDTEQISWLQLSSFGFTQELDAAPEIKGMLIQNVDIEGVAIDLLRFSSFCHPDVS